MTDIHPQAKISAAGAAPSAARKRPKPGERKVQILQTLANMLEQPGSERVTTASLASRLQVSEAALYRHFASKAQIFEGLIEFIETSVQALMDKVTASSPPGTAQAKALANTLLQFAEKNPGMTRVMAGDALVFENERLVVRMGQFMDHIEAQLHACLQASDTQASLRSSVLNGFLMGRLQRYARSNFKRLPTERLEAALNILLD
jgi:TetR/AcrR family transcriptional regulator